MIEKNEEIEILRQYEYLHRDNRMMSKHMLKPNPHQVKMQKSSKESLLKQEVDRLNDVIRKMLEKIKEYEHEWEYLEERRKHINQKFPAYMESEQDAFNKGYKKGFQHGFH